jgi:hypothetical protein
MIRTLHHPFLLPITEVFSGRDKFQNPFKYLYNEWCEGGTLEALI